MCDTRRFMKSILCSFFLKANSFKTTLPFLFSCHLFYQFSMCITVLIPIPWLVPLETVLSKVSCFPHFQLPLFIQKRHFLGLWNLFRRILQNSSFLFLQQELWNCSENVLLFKLPITVIYLEKALFCHWNLCRRIIQIYLSNYRLL